MPISSSATSAPPMMTAIDTKLRNTPTSVTDRFSRSRNVPRVPLRATMRAKCRPLSFTSR
jgi:hypothetical protein